jgi:tagatose-1,6-bisphosphate aldolase
MARAAETTCVTRPTFAEIVEAKIDLARALASGVLGGPAFWREFFTFPKDERLKWVRHEAAN